MDAGPGSGWRRVAGIVCLALIALPQLTHAQDPTLAIRHIGGGTFFYPAVDITRLGFGDDTLHVVTGQGTDYFPAGEIERIDFIWEVADVKDPGAAAALVKALHLFQNLPNPFSPETRIAFELPQAGAAELTIYSFEGRLVRTLFQGELQSGRHELRWGGLNDAGRKVAGGAYFYSLKAPGIEESRRMILLP